MENAKLLNFAYLLNKWGKKHPDKSAIIVLDQKGDELERINYEKLLAGATTIAAGLQQLISPGTTCLLLSQPGLEFAQGLLGCFLAGVIAVPVHPPKKHKKNERFHSILKDAKPDCILMSEKIEEMLNRDPEEWSYLLQKPALTIGNENPVLTDYQEPLFDAGDVALLQYTSGTTGNPNGTMITHRGILHNSEVIKQSFDHDEDLVVVTWLPPYHDMGLIGTLLQPLYVGGTTVVINPADFLREPVIWLNAITQYKGTTAGCPNFALDLLADRITETQKETINLGSLNVFFCGSEPIHPDSMKKFHDSFKTCGFKNEMFLPCYGLAENTLMATGIHRTESPQYVYIDRDNFEKDKQINILPAHENSIGLVGCGKVWLDDQLSVIDVKTGFPLDKGKIGEICLHSKSLCNGYWHKRSDSDKIFTTLNGNGKVFLKTGDLGFVHNNELFIAGRLKEVMKIRGVNHFPIDIENTLRECHPALQPNASAAFQITSDQGEELVILQEVKRVAVRDMDPDDIINEIRNAIASEHEISVHTVALISPGRIPRTSSGKIQRIKSKRMWVEGSIKTLYTWEKKTFDEPEPMLIEQGPSNEEILQNWLINWLSIKLGIEKSKIDNQTPILSYGLDSMGAVELERDVREKFGAEIHPGDFLQNNTISSLVKIGMGSMANNQA